MGMFKSKKSDLSSGPDVPIEQVQAMKAQGYTNNQIIQSLQRDGYTSSQIFDAISQSEMSSNINTSVNHNSMNNNSMNNMPPIQQQNIMQQAESQNMVQNMPQQLPQMNSFSRIGQASNEELIEAIIDEKWNDLVKDINKIIDWKQKADSKIISMEQQVKDLKEQFDKLHQGILGKIGDYDKHMLDVGAELQAMEKVFSKVLPNFVDNINELNRITEDLKVNTKKKPVSNTKKLEE